MPHDVQRWSHSSAIRSEHRGGRAEAAIVVDHAEAADQGMTCVFNLMAGGLMGELADCLDQAEETTGRTGLATG